MMERKPLVTVVLPVYNRERLHVELFGQGFTWLDTGTHESLVDATNFVRTMESHQHRKIGCLEEIAYQKGFIDKAQLLDTAESLKMTEYGRALLRLAER